MLEDDIVTSMIMPAITSVLDETTREETGSIWSVTLYNPQGQQVAVLPMTDETIAKETAFNLQTWQRLWLDRYKQLLKECSLV